MRDAKSGMKLRFRRDRLVQLDVDRALALLLPLVDCRDAVNEDFHPTFLRGDDLSPGVSAILQENGCLSAAVRLPVEFTDVKELL